MKSLAVVLLPVLVCGLSAQETQADRDTIYHLSPIIVTATQARERETPVTFSDITREELNERYSVQDIPVLLSDLPSLTTYSENGNGIGYNYVNLRGFDQRRISVMVNGVPQNDPEDHNVYWLDFPDLLASAGTVQVQRGAGSAFYGPPAIGGSVNLVTNPFDQAPGVTLEAMAGVQEFGGSGVFSLNTKKYAASINSGLIDKQYMLYGRLGKILSDGYRENSWVEFNSYFLGAVRFDETMTTRLHVFGGPIEDGLAYYGLPKFVNSDKTLRRQNLVYWETDPAGYSVAIPRRVQERESFSQPHYEALHEWRLSPSLTVHNTVFYYSGDGYFDYDASWADTSMLRIGTTYGIPATQNPTNTLVRAFVGNKQGGWLPRMEIDHGDGRLTVGAELRFHRSLHHGTILFAEGLPPDFNPDYRFYEYNGERDIVSLYLHELFRLQHDVTLMADLQLVRNRYGIAKEKYLGNSFSLVYWFLNPRLGVNYNFTDQLNGYISLAYTSREPRMRNLYAAEDSYFGATPQFEASSPGGIIRYDFSRPLAKPERLFNVEIGAGYRVERLRASANIYWMEFTDELVKSGQVDIFGQPVTGNAERTRHLGFEAEAAVGLLASISIEGNLSFSRNRLIQHKVYVESTDTSGNTIFTPTDLDGNPIAGFPDVLGNLRSTYRNEGFTGSVAGKYVGSFYTDNFENDRNKNDAYAVVNLETLYRFRDLFGTELTLRAEVRNLFNKLYCMSGEGDAFFPAAERNYLFGITLKL
jgi:iron complex outermembrane receptor protein